MSEKLDRFELFELNQVIEGKANSRDLQQVIQELVLIPGMQQNSRLHNLLCESLI